MLRNSEPKSSIRKIVDKLGYQEKAHRGRVGLYWIVKGLGEEVPLNENFFSRSVKDVFSSDPFKKDNLASLQKTRDSIFVHTDEDTQDGVNSDNGTGEKKTFKEKVKQEIRDLFALPDEKLTNKDLPWLIPHLFVVGLPNAVLRTAFILLPKALLAPFKAVIELPLILARNFLLGKAATTKNPVLKGLATAGYLLVSLLAFPVRAILSPDIAFRSAFHFANNLVGGKAGFALGVLLGGVSLVATAIGWIVCPHLAYVHLAPLVPSVTAAINSIQIIAPLKAFVGTHVAPFVVAKLGPVASAIGNFLTQTCGPALKLVGLNTLSPIKLGFSVLAGGAVATVGATFVSVKDKIVSLPLVTSIVKKLHEKQAAYEANKPLVAAAEIERQKALVKKAVPQNETEPQNGKAEQVDEPEAEDSNKKDKAQSPALGSTASILSSTNNSQNSNIEWGVVYVGEEPEVQSQQLPADPAVGDGKKPVKTSVDYQFENDHPVSKFFASLFCGCCGPREKRADNHPSILIPQTPEVTRNTK